jgi:hypothetical protein
MFVLASPDAFNGEQKLVEPDNVGDLGIPKDAEGIGAQALLDEQAELLAQVGRGDGDVEAFPEATLEGEAAIEEEAATGDDGLDIPEALKRPNALDKKAAAEPVA